MERTVKNTGRRDTRTREQLRAALKTLLCTKPLDQIRVVTSGAGAAGVAIIRLLMSHSTSNGTARSVTL